MRHWDLPEVYMEEAFKNHEWKTSNGDKKRLDVAKKLGKTSIMFLVHPTLKEHNMQFIIEQMYTTMKNASR